MHFIGHRGYSTKYRENTLAAFEAVMTHPEHGKSVIGIELDIQLTADEKIVVFHDLEITHNGQKKKICDLQFNQLPDEVPLFSAVLDQVQHKSVLFVEIKDNDYDKAVFVDFLDQILVPYQPAGDIIIHSFSTEILNICFQNITTQNIQYGFLFGKIDALDQLKPGFLKTLHYLHPSSQCLLENMDKIANYQLPVNTWTVNDTETLRHIISADTTEIVNAIITDELSLAER